jgi:5-methylcytosine-specific restriction endonuclease McrA
MAMSEAERKLRKNARTRADRAANPEKYRARDRARSQQRAHQMRVSHKARYDADPEKYRAKTRAFNAANPEKKRAWDKRYAAENVEKLRVSRNAQYAKNPQGQAIRAKRYSLKHPEVGRRASLKYRARKKKATIGDTNLITEWEATWKLKRTVSCYWCRKRIKTSAAHVDHVVPLSKGGEHSVDNLCVSCEKCNLTKQAKLPEDFVKTMKQPPLFVRMD